MHEMLHAFGHIHEHTAPLRDKYIDIFWENMKPGYVRRIEISVYASINFPSQSGASVFPCWLCRRYDPRVQLWDPGDRSSVVYPAWLQAADGKSGILLRVNHALLVQRCCRVSESIGLFFCQGLSVVIFISIGIGIQIILIIFGDASLRRSIYSFCITYN